MAEPRLLGCVWFLGNLHFFVTPRLVFDDGEQRFTFHPLFLFQLEQLLTQYVLVSLSQPATERCGFTHTHTLQTSIQTNRDQSVYVSL